MSRRKLLWACVPVLIVLGFIGAWAAFKPHTVTMTESQLQSRINAQLDTPLPVSGIAGTVVRSVRMKSATIHIQNGRVLAAVDVEGETKSGKTFSLTAEAVGIPSYAGREFYFRPEHVTVSNLAFEGGSLTKLVHGFAERYVSDEKTRLLIEDNAPGFERWTISLAQSAAFHALEKRAIYRLKDDVKGLIIAAALDEVRVDGNSIVVTFSLLQLTMSLLLALFCLVAAIAFALFLITHPEFAIGIASLFP